jgi:hypothetical protein
MSTSTPAPVYKGRGGYRGGGRPPGALNHATREFKAWLDQFFSSDAFREKTMQRILDGTESPQITLYLLQMRYGKPREIVDLNVTTYEDLSTLSVEELHERARELVEQLDDAKALAEAIDIEPSLREPVEQERQPCDNATSAAENAARSGDV